MSAVLLPFRTQHKYFEETTVLNFSRKSTTAANVDLMESLLDNWLKNNHF